MVSVILCTFNRAHTLKETIDSILNQTYKNFELIIVDDGSTDNTKELIESYKDERIRAHYRKENQFYCAAANYGIAQAKGEYIAFATSDDIWELDKLELQIYYLEARPECGACFSFADIIDENGDNANDNFAGLAKLFSETHHAQKEWIRRFFLEGNCLCHPSAVVRKNVMDEVGGYNLMFCQSADMELWLRIVRKHPIHVIEKILVHYRWYQNPQNQVSGADELKTARLVNEHMIIRREFIEELTDEETITFFADRFRNPESVTHEEIEIEKAFLLMNCSNQLPDFRILGIEKFEKLLRNPENLNILKEKYQVTIQDLYKWNLGHFYVDYGISKRMQEQKRQIEDEQEQLRIEKEFTESLQRQRRELNEEIKQEKEKIVKLEEELERIQKRCVTAERNLETADRELQEVTEKHKNTQALLEKAMLEKLEVEESRKKSKYLRDRRMQDMRRTWKQAGTVTVAMTMLVMMSLTGCGKSTKSEKSDGTSDFQGDFIISAQQAVEKMDDEDVLFVDARDDVEKTMKGAVHISWPSITIQDGVAGDATWCTVPEPEKLQQLLQEKGIEKDREIIVLGLPENGWGEDGRVLWELREAGCTNLKFVDGGISAMKDVGAEFDSAVTVPEKSDIEIKELDKSHDITTEELQKNYDDYKIVDVRRPKEYEGAVLFEEAQGGHLPGAVNIPYVDMFQKDGTLKSNEEITEMFEAQGIHKDDKVVTYCTGGIRAAYTQLVLEMCGYKNTYNYLQSFWRWAAVGEVEK